MTIDENGTITIYNGDYGMPIVFEIDELSAAFLDETPKQI